MANRSFRIPSASLPGPRRERSADELTRLLNELGRGATPDTTEMVRIVYAELKAIAEGCLSAERPGITLQATALVNEAFVKLFGRRDVEWEGRRHFYAVAAIAMRRLLVDAARRQRRRPRADTPTLEEAIAAGSGIEVDLIDLDAALDELAELDARQSQIVELKYFGGLAVADVARVLDLSKTTVEREWRAAKAWLARRLGERPE